MTEPSSAQDRAAGPRVVLVGAPGAGKTSVGAELARRWGVSFLDTDQVIEADQHTSVSDIFVDQGEAVFRALEETAVAAALTQQRGVVALGGGAILSAATRDRLADQTVVFLDVGLAASSGRIGLGVTRPLLLGNVRSQLKALLDARRPLYLKAATAVVVTDDRDVTGVADEVERLLP